jgi:hypothetical protein
MLTIPVLNQAFEPIGAIATHAALLTGIHGLVITAGKVLTVQDNVTISGALGTGAYATINDYALVGQTMNIGTTTVAINRASGALVLTGITSIDGTAANASQLLTGTWAIPGTIGSTTPNTGLFTTMGIGTGIVTPATVLQTVDTITSSPRGIMSSQYNTGTHGAQINLRKARNTFASPVIIVSGDSLGQLVASGYDGTNYKEMGSIIFGTEGTIGINRIPTNIQFWTGTNATTSVLTQAGIIDSSQNWNFLGHTLYGNLTSSGTLTLQSTSHATKGKILFGTSTYDEANNRLGIGTTSPGVMLDIKSGSITIQNATHSIGNFSEAQSIIFTGEVSTASIAEIVAIRTGWSGAPTDLVFKTRLNDSPAYAVERMRILSTGNVGIGTTIPDSQFEIMSDASNYSKTLSLSQYGIGNNLWRYGFVSTSDGNLNLSSAWDMFKIYIDTNNDAPATRQFSVYEGTAVGSGTPTLRVGGANVGIGLTSPAATLDILNSSTTNGLALKITTTLWQATDDEVAYQLNYTTNKATSGNDTGLVINQTDTASPGTSLLIDAQVGRTSKFRVDNTGVFGSSIYILPTFTNANDNKLYIATSFDGKTWSQSPKVFGDTHIRDSSIMLYNNIFYISYTNGSLTGTFNIISSTDLSNWNAVATVNPGLGAYNTYAPEWFVEPSDGSIHIFFASNASGQYHVYEIAAQNAALTSWSAPTQVATTNGMNDPFVMKVGSTYYLWYTNIYDVSNYYVSYATSSSLNSGYTVIKTGDWAGWGSGYEGQSLRQINNNTWRLYAAKVSESKMYYSESTDNWVTWSAFVPLVNTGSITMNHGTPLILPLGTSMGNSATPQIILGNGTSTGCIPTMLGTGVMGCSSIFQSVDSGVISIRNSSNTEVVWIQQSGLINSVWGFGVNGTSVLTGSLLNSNGADVAFNIMNRSFSASNTALTMVYGTFSGAGVTQVGVKISPTINQTTTSGMTDLLINRIETAVGSGAQLLIDAQVATVSYFAVSNKGSLIVPTTITAPGTTGNQTINKLAGRVNIAAAGTTITVTNSLVTANSIIVATVATNDTTASVKNVVAATGSFTINVVGVTAETAINFIVIT